MFERFSRCFGVNVKRIDFSNKSKYLNLSNDVIEFFINFEGETFDKGLYRVHKLENITKWNKIIEDAYPEFKDRIQCFSYDWLGRQFAIDNNRFCEGRPLILMFEPGTSDVLEIPCNFVDFHEVEIVDYHDSCLASSFYKDWKRKVDDSFIKPKNCIAYKVPLFLGGIDDLDNLELSDMEVYWGVYSQLIRKTK